MSGSGSNTLQLDDFDEDNIRIGVVRETMNSNPLLVKAPLGKPKLNTRNPNQVYGVKSKKDEGGTAAAFSGRLNTPLESEAAKRAKERNPLLFKSDVGRARKPLDEKVVGMVHGSKTTRGMGVKDSIAAWSATETSTSRSHEPEVGRAKPPMSASTADKVHGMVAKKKDGGAAEVMSSWMATGAPSRETTNPLLIKADVGHARHTLGRDVQGRVHGMKSVDPKVDGGVMGALSSWDRPDTQDANQRFKDSSKIHKAELGRARPPISSATARIVHGKANPRSVPGARDALSDWNPPTPERRGRRRGAEVPGNVAFGKPSGKSEGLSDLIRHSYQKQWLKEQLAKQSQSLEVQQEPPKQWP